MKPTKPILLVEDDTVDQVTVKRAFRQLKIAGRLDIAANGVEALALLQDKVGSFEQGVAGYIIKPIDYEDFIEVVRAIDSYWRLSERAEPGPRPRR
ncbi:MAG: response regulator receiver protein [uncultured bacterium]|nr:MAG: response regulator receiver protein [uncultured bacterium]